MNNILLSTERRHCPAFIHFSLDGLFRTSSPASRLSVNVSTIDSNATTPITTKAIIAPPIPCKILAAVNVARSVLNAQHTDANVKTSIAAVKSRFSIKKAPATNKGRAGPGTIDLKQQYQAATKTPHSTYCYHDAHNVYYVKLNYCK